MGTTPAELAIGGRAVRLDGYYRQPHKTLEVLDAKGNKIVLLVASVRTDRDQAYAIAMAAPAPGGPSRVDTLLMISVKARKAARRGQLRGSAGIPTAEPLPGVFSVWRRADRAVTSGTKQL